MSGYLIAEFAAICRLCLKQDGVMSCIFNNVMDTGEFDPLAARITEFFHVQVIDIENINFKYLFVFNFRHEVCFILI